MKAGTQECRMERGTKVRCKCAGNKMQNDERACTHCEGAHSYTGRGLNTFASFHTPSRDMCEWS